MQQTANYYSNILRTFDGLTHKLIANKVGDDWHAQAIVDGQVLRGLAAKTLEKAIANFRVRYQTEFDR